jgi:hypothetical protein
MFTRKRKKKEKPQKFKLPRKRKMIQYSSKSGGLKLWLVLTLEKF